MNTEKNISVENLVSTQHPDYKNKIVEIIRGNLTPRLMREQILDYHENDIADALEVLKKDERFRLYSILDTETLASIFEYSEKISIYMGELGIRKRVDVLSHLEVTTAVEYLRQLGKSDRNTLMELMDEESKREIHLLSSFDEDEIGSKMSTNFIKINAEYPFLCR